MLVLNNSTLFRGREKEREGKRDGGWRMGEIERRTGGKKRGIGEKGRRERAREEHRGNKGKEN